MKQITLVVMLCMPLIIMPAVADDYTVRVFGNANMDDTIDEDDIAYVEGIIDRTSDETELSDANYDGKIDKEDIVQIEMIIAGEETELTLIDMADRIIKIPYPIERIVSPSMDGIRTVVQLGDADKIVGIPSRLVSENVRLPAVVHPELAELPAVGWQDDAVSYAELITSLEPDIIIGESSYADELQGKTGTPVVCLWTQGCLDFDIYIVMGTILGKEKKVEELISFADDKLSEITDITSQISEDEKPRVYMELYQNFTTPIKYDPIDLAGGVNVAANCVGDYSVQISKEQLIAWNPDIIVLQRMWTKSNSSYSKAQVEDFLSDPDYQYLNAVVSGEVYHTIGHSAGWDPATGVVETIYMSKLFHPDKFADINMEVEGNEILKMFYGADGLYTSMSDGRRLHEWEYVE